jgi:hypothetical protein
MRNFAKAAIALTATALLVGWLGFGEPRRSPRFPRRARPRRTLA